MLFIKYLKLPLYINIVVFFYSEKSDLSISKYNIGLIALLREGLSEPECDGDIIYKFRKIVGKVNFLDKI